jgi:hypothetical protein
MFLEVSGPLTGPPARGKKIRFGPFPRWAAAGQVPPFSVNQKKRAGPWRARLFSADG